MRTLFLITLAFLAFNSLCAIDISINDEDRKYFLNSTLGFNISVYKDGHIEKNELIQSARAIRGPIEDRNLSTFYEFFIQLGPSETIIRSINLTLEAERSKDDVRRYIREFELSLEFDGTTEMKNWTDMALTFVVRPPKFPHFQVKSDWRFSCPKNLSLPLCHVANGTNACSQDKPYSLVEVRMLLADIVFNGGKPRGHDYSAKIEECPLAYETSQDIGIACIAVFWGIALIFATWGLVKFLIKRHRKRMD